MFLDGSCCLLRAVPEGTPRMLILHKEGLKTDADALASALHGLDPMQTGL